MVLVSGMLLTPDNWSMATWFGIVLAWAGHLNSVNLVKIMDQLVNFSIWEMKTGSKYCLKHKMLITNAFLKFNSLWATGCKIEFFKQEVSLNRVLVFLYDWLELYIGHDVSVHQDEVALYDWLRIYLAQRVSDR